MISVRDLRAPTRDSASLSPQKRGRNHRTPCPVVRVPPTARRAVHGSAPSEGECLRQIMTGADLAPQDGLRGAPPVSTRSHFADFEIRLQGKSIVSWQEGVNDRGAYLLSSRGQSLAEDHARTGPHLADDRDDRDLPSDRAPVLSHPAHGFAAPFRPTASYLQPMQLRDWRIPAWSHP